jgi:phosphate transport system substrate-binding protein
MTHRHAQPRFPARRRLLQALALTPFLGVPPVRAAALRLTLTGSSTIAPLMAEIGKRYEAQHPGARIDVQTGGSSRGITDARKRLADIGMVSRSLKAAEADLVAWPIARDGIALIVHRDNPLRALSDAQVIALFTGQVKNWREVGGAERAVSIVNKAEGRSTLELFLAHFKLKNSQIRAQVVIGDNQQGIKSVIAHPGTLGYVSIGSAEQAVAAGLPLRLLPLGGVAASTAHVLDGTYPLARVLNLVTLPAPPAAVRALLAYSASSAVHDLVRDQFFVPL